MRGDHAFRIAEHAAHGVDVVDEALEEEGRAHAVMGAGPCRRRCGRRIP